jgi:hypothetical protein
VAAAALVLVLFFELGHEELAGEAPVRGDALQERRRLVAAGALAYPLVVHAVTKLVLDPADASSASCIDPCTMMNMRLHDPEHAPSAS